MSLSEVAAQLLRSERADVAATLSNAYEQDFDRLTFWDGWRVRDLVAHLIVVLEHVVTPQPTFTGSPRDAVAGGAAHRDRVGHQLATELDAAYRAAPEGPDAVRLALWAWLVANDMREALNSPEPYCGNAVPEAVALLVHVSKLRDMVPVDVTVTDAFERGLDDASVCLGDPARAPEGWLRTDVAGLFRIVAGRRIELVERELVGVSLADLAILE